jgi:hypothetical protein
VANWTVTGVEQREELTRSGGFRKVLDVHWIYHPTSAEYVSRIAEQDASDPNSVADLINAQAQIITALHGLSG